MMNATSLTYPLPHINDYKETPQELWAWCEDTIKSIPKIKAKGIELKAALAASPYANAQECPECGGQGAWEEGGISSAGEYEGDWVNCDHCLLEGVHPWDVNTSWFTLEAAQEHLDEGVEWDDLDDYDQREVMEWMVTHEVTQPPKVIQDLRDYKDVGWPLLCLKQNLQVLKNHYEEQGEIESVALITPKLAWVMGEIEEYQEKNK